MEIARCSGGRSSHCVGLYLTDTDIVSVTQIHRYFINIGSKTCIAHNESFSFINPSRCSCPYSHVLLAHGMEGGAQVLLASPDDRARRESGTMNPKVNLKREHVKVKREREM